MTTTISAQITSQGLLIPRTAIQEWLDQGLEIVKDSSTLSFSRARFRALNVSGLNRFWNNQGGLSTWTGRQPSPPLTDQERAELAQKFGVGRPLSEIIIEERGER